MIVHNIKVSIRTLLRYKVQSFFCIISLAAAFACVALAAYWSHYEENYDSFHRNADCIYRCSIEYLISGRVRVNQNGNPLRIPSYLEENYPEVKKACAVLLDVPVDVNARCMVVTPEAVEMFDFEWIEGNPDIALWTENQVGISDEYARKLFGDSSPIGKRMNCTYSELSDVEVAAVYKAWSRHSNFRTDLLSCMKPENKWGKFDIKEFFFMLHSSSNHEHLIEKLRNDTIEGVARVPFTIKKVIPLKSLHYEAPIKKANMQIKYVHLFSWVAVLLSICALLNYLTLFVSRLTAQGRNLALRTVCGSSGWQLGKLLMVEYLLLLLVAFFLSFVFMECVMYKFMEFAMIEVSRSTIYAGCFAWLLFVVMLAMLLSAIPILYFKNKTLRMQIEPTTVMNRKNPFRKASVCVQLFASMLFMFCATVMIKQVYFLVYADIGIERKGIAYMTLYHRHDKQAAMEYLKQQPVVKDVQPIEDMLYPLEFCSNTDVFTWEEKAENAPSFFANTLRINDSIAKFFGINIKEGVHSFDALNGNEILIDETFAKTMGVANPIGKSIHPHPYSRKIVGIVSDFQAQNPTEPQKPKIFSKHSGDIRFTNFIAIKYDGEFKEVRDAITNTLEQKGFDVMSFIDAEEKFKGYMVYEYNFLKLLSVVTCVIILIALFGVYALILQECERQRKNIAIRKVCGAQVKDILIMFFKEYMLQVVLAAALAFPVGYVLMKRWLEGYSRQIGLGLEIFMGLFVGMALIVLLCIGWHVWCAANENPAMAVEKE